VGGAKGGSQAVQIGDVVSVIFERSSSKWVETKGHAVEWSEDRAVSRAGGRPRAGADRTRAVHINEVLSLETTMDQKSGQRTFQVSQSQSVGTH
jgi:hypothetical protein